MKTIRLGTRPSALAMWQATWTRDALVKLGLDVEIVQITTTGDSKRHEAIVNLGAQGVFTKEIQGALLAGDIDLAVHSLKDLPVEKVPGLKLVASPERADTRDVFVSNRYASIDDLPPGARLGTSSMRRKSMALRYCRKRFPHDPAWDVREIRGNVETRLKKLDDGEYDAIILASAGLTRLGFGDRARSFLDSPEFLTSVGQGALGFETREDDAETIEQVVKLRHEPTWLSVLAERALLKRLEGGCIAPIGARASVVSVEGAELISLDAEILAFDGAKDYHTQSLQVLRANASDRELPLETKEQLAELLGANAAETLLDLGATEIVAEIQKSRAERAARLSAPHQK